MSTTTRRADRRRELIDAARRVAREKGLVGLNVRAVASEAAVSSGSVIYHFGGFDDLVYAAIEGVLEEFYEQRRALTEQIPDVRARLVALVTAGIPDEISEDLRLVYESISLLRAHPEYLPLHRSIVERQVQLYLTTIEIGVATGVFHARMAPSVAARHLVALEDAYDLYPLLGLATDRARVRDSILEFAELALDCTLRT